MVEVLPISGITYNQSRDDINIKDVIAPPYDVISEEEQDNYYAASPYNIVRLILNKSETSDTDENNKYTRAAGFFNDWLKSEHLTKSEKPFIYYYIQNYTTVKNQKISRKGFIANVKIEDFSSKKVLPHEYTMGGPKEDRLKLMKQCNANFSQIFMLYSDVEKEIDKALTPSGKPFIDTVDSQGVQNIIYIIDDEAIIAKVNKIMEDKTLLIADGHHRYETAIAYRNYMREKIGNFSENEPFNYVMSYFTNMDDENLIVYPTHRIITRTVDSAKLLNDLIELFDVEEFHCDKTDKQAIREAFVNKIEEESLKNITFGICVNPKSFYIVKIKDRNAVNSLLGSKEVPDVLKKLDLSVLHKIIITDYLQIKEEDQMKQNGIKYIKKEEEAFNSLDNGEASIIFVMATPSIEIIKEISEEGYRMPQKSTYFYPKLISGLVINPLL
ncbi:MAG: DUF1015 domain-containing protein [Candidatus Gastranaerophilaceae bacterium]|jgi:uncharacterized protein (DUF1015 family)